MIVSSTELKNNFGRYLILSAKEPVIVTKNGVKVARLTSIIKEYDKKRQASVAETSRYIYGGREATYKEYLELEQNSTDRYEYIDGEIYYMTSPRTTHQRILSELFVTFYNFFQEKSCTAMIAPYDITLKRDKDDINIVQPDLMVICDLEKHLDERDYYLGVPDLVLEIISESTRSKDMVKKLDLYLSCGIGEYWLVNPFNQEITIYLFKDKEIIDFKTCRKDESAESYSFKELKIELKGIFK